MKPIIRRREPPIPASAQDPIDDRALTLCIQNGANDPKMVLGYVLKQMDAGYDVFIATGPTKSDYYYSGHAKTWRETYDLLPLRPWGASRGMPVARKPKGAKPRRMEV